MYGRGRSLGNVPAASRFTVRPPRRARSGSGAAVPRLRPAEAAGPQPTRRGSRHGLLLGERRVPPRGQCPAGGDHAGIQLRSPGLAGAEGVARGPRRVPPGRPRTGRSRAARGPPPLPRRSRRGGRMGPRRPRRGRAAPRPRGASSGRQAGASRHPAPGPRKPGRTSPRRAVRGCAGWRAGPRPRTAGRRRTRSGLAPTRAGVGCGTSGRCGDGATTHDKFTSRIVTSASHSEDRMSFQDHALQP
jgi:hypothetical protein